MLQQPMSSITHKEIKHAGHIKGEAICCAAHDIKGPRSDLYKSDRRWFYTTALPKMEDDKGEIKFCKVCGEKFKTKYGVKSCPDCRARRRQQKEVDVCVPKNKTD